MVEEAPLAYWLEGFSPSLASCPIGIMSQAALTELQEKEDNALADVMHAVLEVRCRAPAARAC